MRVLASLSEALQAASWHIVEVSCTRDELGHGRPFDLTCDPYDWARTRLAFPTRPATHEHVSLDHEDIPRPNAGPISTRRTLLAWSLATQCKKDLPHLYQSLRDILSSGIEAVGGLGAQNKLSKLLAVMPSSIEDKTDLYEKYTAKKDWPPSFFKIGSSDKLLVEIIFNLLSVCAENKGGLKYLRHIIRATATPSGKPAAVAVTRITGTDDHDEVQEGTKTCRWSVGTTLLPNQRHAHISLVVEEVVKDRQELSHNLLESAGPPPAIIEAWTNTPNALEEELKLSLGGLRGTSDRVNPHGRSAGFLPLLRAMLCSTLTNTLEVWTFRNDQLIPPCLSDLVRHYVLSLYTPIKVSFHYGSSEDVQHTASLGVAIERYFNHLPDDARPRYAKRPQSNHGV